MDEMTTLLFESLRGETHQHFAVLWNFHPKRGFGGDGDRLPELVQMIKRHEDVLIKLLKKNIVTFHWNDGDAKALVTLIPEKARNASDPFKTVDLAFPPRDSVLVQ